MISVQFGRVRPRGKCCCCQKEREVFTASFVGKSIGGPLCLSDLGRLIRLLSEEGAENAEKEESLEAKP